MTSFVKTNIRKNYIEIEFFTPQSNSLPGSILSELAIQIHQANDITEKSVIVLKSFGEKAFCAGASFDELSKISSHEEGKSFFSGFSNVILSMISSKKIIIGRIHGKAVGGGVGLAAACDYSIANQYASIRLSELAVGIGPFVIGPAVERKIGIAAYSQLALNATEWQTADWAKSKGLFQEVFPSTQQMDDYIEHFTGILSNSNPEALEQLKQVFWKNTDHWPQLMNERAALSGSLALSEFTKKSIEKFKSS